VKRFFGRFRGSSGGRRAKRILLAPILVAAAVALWSVGGAQAVHDLGLFELDNNTVDGAAAGDDWDQVFNATDDCASIGAIACTFVEDEPNQTIFTGGGSKDDLDIPNWLSSTGSVPDKDELTNAYAALYSTGGMTPQAVLYFGADRFAQNGSANLGFWFFKSPVSVNEDGTFSGVHSVGDILILSEFTNGGAVSTIAAFEWVGTGGDTNGTLDSLTLGPPGTPADCDALLPGAAHNACATVNGVGIQPAWPYTPKQGPAGTIPPGGFFEGGLNLSALGLTGCFSSFLAETRSSPSVDAVLKDFVTGAFNPCSARISIRPPEDTNEVDENHVLTVKVEKEDPSTGFSLGPAVGVEVTGTITSGPGSFVGGDNTCTTDVNGECTLTITSAQPGVTTVSASASVTLSEGTVVDVSTDGVAPNSGPATKRWVDGKISVTPLMDTNGITENHTVTATVEQDDGLPAPNGDGFSPVAGATVTFSLLNNTANAVFVPAGANTCTTNASGQCSITITSSTAGSVDINATSTFNVGGVSLTRTTGTGAPNSADANKVFVDGTLRWLKHDQDGNPLGGAVFEVCRTHNFNSNTGQFDDIDPDACVSVTDNSPPDVDPDPGELQLEDLILGRYTIRETQPPPGFSPDPDTETVELTIANPSNTTNPPVFVNERLFKVIVVTCNDSLEVLVDSTVTINNEQKETITGVPAHLAAKGVTEADLCGIGGASYGNLPANPNLDADIELPDVAPLFPPTP
jgi:Prealbumin-like fold domain